MLASLSQRTGIQFVVHFQSQVRAVSEWGAEGEWAVESVPQKLAAPTSAAAEGESSTCAHNDHHIT